MIENWRVNNPTHQTQNLSNQAESWRKITENKNGKDKEEKYEESKKSEANEDRSTYRLGDSGLEANEGLDAKENSWLHKLRFKSPWGSRQATGKLSSILILKNCDKSASGRRLIVTWNRHSSSRC